MSYFDKKMKRKKAISIKSEGERTAGNIGRDQDKPSGKKVVEEEQESCQMEEVEAADAQG